jgi:hypothetical protein
MDFDIETRYLILGVHLFAGLGFFGLAVLGASAGQLGAAAFRLALGLMITGLGVFLYLNRS